MSNLLVVEDESHLAGGLKFNLEAEGHSVEIVDRGEDALQRLRSGHSFDAVVLDVMLPGKNGFQVVSELRAANEYVPVLMLTARGRPEDVLQGFAAGADDYLPKPFDLEILMARIRGLLRRRDWMRTHAPAQTKPSSSAPAEANGADGESGVVRFNGKIVDFRALELRVRDRTFRLTMMEAELLRHLIKNSGQVVSRKSILEEVWGLHEDTDTRAIDNFIVRLRRYIEDQPTAPRHLLTVRGVGYRFISAPGKK
jgi:DNA-binding response OmpR family regulator